MCDAKPGLRCATDTRDQVHLALTRYQAAHPDGPAVDPLASAEASIGTPISVPDPRDPTDIPIYEGAAADAAGHLAPGTYTAEHLHDGDAYELTVRPLGPDALETSILDYDGETNGWIARGHTHPFSQDSLIGKIAVHTDPRDGTRVVGNIYVSGDERSWLEHTDGPGASHTGAIEIVNGETGGLENVPARVQRYLSHGTDAETRRHVIDASQNAERRAHCAGRAVAAIRWEQPLHTRDLTYDEVVETAYFPRHMTEALARSGAREGAYWAWKDDRPHADDSAYEDIWAGRSPGVSEQEARDKLTKARQALADHDSGKGKPARPERSREDLQWQVWEYTEAIASRGRSLSLNQDNVADPANARYTPAGLRARQRALRSSQANNSSNSQQRGKS